MTETKTSLPGNNNNTSTTPPPVLTNTKHTHWKNLAVILGIISLVSTVTTIFLLYKTFLQSESSVPLPTLQNIDKSSTSNNQPTTTSTESSDQFFDWQTYTNQEQGIMFQYPSNWIKQPQTLTGSGFYQEIKDPLGKYLLNLKTIGNYNQETGKQYQDIDEFIGKPSQVKTVRVDGQAARQPNPRAESENVNSAYFFSKDSKHIYTLSLQTGDTKLNTAESDIQEGQLIFDQILSTFKFLDQNYLLSEPMGIKYLLPENWELNEYANKGFGFSFLTKDISFSSTSDGLLTSGAYITVSIYPDKLNPKLLEIKNEFTSLKDTIIDQYMSEKYSGIDSGTGNDQIAVITEMPNKAYLFILNYRNSNLLVEKNINDFNQILNSISIIPQKGELPIINPFTGGNTWN